MPPLQSEPRTEGAESDEVNDEFEDIRVLLAPQFDLTGDDDPRKPESRERR